MRHKIFLVHGMGVYDGDTWADQVKAVLVKAYGQYPGLAAVDFDTRFEIVMIHYDPVFQEIVTKWQTDAKALAPLADQVGAPLVASLVGWLQTAAKTDDNFLWTHAADVLLYRLSATVRERVKAFVAQQIVDGISQQYDEHQQSLWSVVAHSLGTAVVHDTLDMLATGTVPGVAVNAFDPTIEQAQVVAMIANVSRLLETVPDAYLSAVQPGKAGQPGRDCLRYLTVRHVLDPFAIPHMFHPQEWPDAATVAAGRYQYVEVAHIHQANVHDVCHYLANPAAHIPLFQALAGDTRISKTDAKKALDGFPQLGTLTPEQAAAIKKDLAAVSPSIGDAWTSLKKIWDEYHAVLQARGEA